MAPILSPEGGIKENSVFHLIIFLPKVWTEKQGLFFRKRPVGRWRGAGAVSQHPPSGKLPCDNSSYMNNSKSFSETQCKENKITPTKSRPLATGRYLVKKSQRVTRELNWHKSKCQYKLHTVLGQIQNALQGS